MNQAVEAVVNEVEVKESGKSTFMQRVWAKMGKEEKGFTLIELLAVLIIIAIIAVIAIPLIGGIINKSKDGADVSTASQVYNAARLYVVGEKNGDFKAAGSIKASELISGGYLEAKTVLPSTKKALDGTNTTVSFDATSGALTTVVLADGTAAGNKHTFTADEVLKAEKAKSGSGGAEGEVTPPTGG